MKAAATSRLLHPGLPRVGAVRWRVQPGHAEFGGTASNWRGFLVGTSRVTEFFALVTTAIWRIDKRRERTEEVGSR